MSALNLGQLASSLRDYAPDGPINPEEIRHQLHSAIQACIHEDPTNAEALLACLLEAFISAGDRGQVLMDDMVLEFLPATAALAGQSAECSRMLLALCSFAATACSPRDMIAASLALMDALVEDSPGPEGLQFACSLMLMLPEQVNKLSRCKTANALECCKAVAHLARVHGGLLAVWSVTQMAQAAQQAAGAAGGSRADSPADTAAGTTTFTKLDTFLAMRWQAYAEFAEAMASQVAQQEPSPDAFQQGCHNVSTLVLQLLQHLTTVWPPPALRPLTLLLLEATGSDQLLPGADSVAHPVPMLGTATSCHQHSSCPLSQQQHTSGCHGEGVVAALLSILRECGTTSWLELSEHGSHTAAGAGLAVLYSSCSAGDDEQHGFQLPSTAEQVVQCASDWCCAIAAASDNNVIALLKGVALLQLAARHAKQLHQPAVSQAPAAAAQTSATPAAAGEQPDADTAMVTAARLLPHLQPCMALVAGVVAQAPVQALRSQAALALRQLLQALPSAVRYAVLQQLLLQGSPGGLHPEVAALLMQEVRGMMAHGDDACFSPDRCIKLVQPWLEQHGAVGWCSADVLPDRSNALCAALATLRLALLKSQPPAQAPAAAAADTSMGNQQLQQQQQQPWGHLKPALEALSAAVGDALGVLRVATNAEQAAADDVEHGSSSSSSDGRQRVPGEAVGSGQAVDAWLAVSRLQDMLDRVGELLV